MKTHHETRIFWGQDGPKTDASIQKVTTFQGPWVHNLLSRIITRSQPFIPIPPDGAQEASVRNFLHQSGTNAKKSLANEKDKKSEY